jgi:hypothetical protein
VCVCVCVVAPRCFHAGPWETTGPHGTGPGPHGTTQNFVRPLLLVGLDQHTWLRNHPQTCCHNPLSWLVGLQGLDFSSNICNFNQNVVYVLHHVSLVAAFIFLMLLRRGIRWMAQYVRSLGPHVGRWPGPSSSPLVATPIKSPAAIVSPTTDTFRGRGCAQMSVVGCWIHVLLRATFLLVGRCGIEEDPIFHWGPVELHEEHTGPCRMGSAQLSSAWHPAAQLSPKCYKLLLI